MGQRARRDIRHGQFVAAEIGTVRQDLVEDVVHLAATRGRRGNGVGTALILRKPEEMVQIDRVERGEVQRTPIHPFFRFGALAQRLGIHVPHAVFGAEVSRHRAGFPKREAVVFLQGR